jgi:hypothetical protein
MKTRNKILLRILLLALIFTTSLGFAQVDSKTKATVNKMAKQMFIDMNNRDYDAIIEMSYPKLFELAPKDMVKNMIKSALEGNEAYSIEIPKFDPNKYGLSEIKVDKSASLAYAFVSYDIDMKMTFNNQTFDETAKAMMKSEMESKGMDAEFLSDNTVKMMMKNRITILIKDKNTNQKWAMINYEEGSSMFADLLPAVVMEDAKKYAETLKKE